MTMFLSGFFCALALVCLSVYVGGVWLFRGFEDDPEDK